MTTSGSSSPQGPAGFRRRSVAAARSDWVQVARLDHGRELPAVIRPAVDGVDAVDWAKSERERIDQLLLEHRALLLRGFGITDVALFDRLVQATSDGSRLEYRDRTTPRTTEGDRIYTATVHPADQRIHLHNEGTYWVRWAKKLYFCCLIAPSHGGQTPIADVRRVYGHIAPAVRARFEQLGFMLVRNFNEGFGLPWQEVFQTDSRAEVEDYCRENQIEVHWRGQDRLRTRQVRPAVRRHPATGEPVWFNHAAFYHHTTLDVPVRDALLAEFGEDGLPYNTLYGDGAPIEPEVAEHLRECYAREKVAFPWERGDVMLLDNMSVAHGREPFEGDRRVVVAMTEPIDEHACSTG